MQGIASKNSELPEKKHSVLNRLIAASNKTKRSSITTNSNSKSNWQPILFGNNSLKKPVDNENPKTCQNLHYFQQTAAPINSTTSIGSTLHTCSLSQKPTENTIKQLPVNNTSIRRGVKRECTEIIDNYSVTSKNSVTEKRPKKASSQSELKEQTKVTPIIFSQDSSILEPIKFRSFPVQDKWTSADYMLEFCRVYEIAIKDEKNMQHAFQYCQEAAEQGSVPARCMVAYCYENGIGVEKSSAHAFHNYKILAEKNFAPAQYAVAAYYEYGVEVVKDIKIAIKYYQHAAEQGYSFADVALSRFSK